MKIQEQELFHGAALTQIVEFVEQNVSITKIKNEFGYYIVNDQKHLILKYRSNNRSPWRFGLSLNEYKLIQSLVTSENEFYLVLICGGNTICILNKVEVELILDTDNTHEQWMNVETKHNSSMWVSGSKGELKYSIRHNDFPKKIFLKGELE